MKRDFLYISNDGRAHVLIDPPLIERLHPIYRMQPYVLRTEPVHEGRVIDLRGKHGPVLRAQDNPWNRALTYSTPERLAEDMDASLCFTGEVFQAAVARVMAAFETEQATWPQPVPRPRRKKSAEAPPKPATPDFNTMSGEEFAAYLGAWKEKHGLSLAGMAKALGVDKKTVWVWLEGRLPTLPVVLGHTLLRFDEHPELLRDANPVRWPKAA